MDWELVINIAMGMSLYKFIDSLVDALFGLVLTKNKEGK